jgi:glycosyltransferase involved in cell wall biosynthesis
MRSVVFVVPGSIDTRTGGSIYDRRMTEGLRELGWSVEVRELEGAFPFPSPAALDQAAAVFAPLQDRAIVVVDGLALGAMPDIIEREASRLRIVALIHLPLAADLSNEGATSDRLKASEQRALGGVSLIIATGSATLPLLEKYGLSRDRVIVVEPGTDKAALARGSGGRFVELLCVATLNPGKGHAILLGALAQVPLANWHLTCAGNLTPHPEIADRLRGMALDLHLEGRVAIVGELDRAALADCYDRADLFVLATLQETYGMAVAEALACGLPVVSTTTGAIPDLVGEEAGLLVAPGDTKALTDALARVIDDADLRARLAEGARRVRDRLPTWEQASAQMSAALAQLDGC